MAQIQSASKEKTEEEIKAHLKELIREGELLSVLQGRIVTSEVRIQVEKANLLLACLEIKNLEKYINLDKNNKVRGTIPHMNTQMVQ